MTFSLKAKNILVIDDFPGMRKSVREMLYTLDAVDIKEVGSGIEAIGAMEKDRYDIVLCDYNLGTGKTGLQVLEEARVRQLLPFSTVFIMITAEQTPGMVLGAMENRPDEYLTKPFTTRQLLSRIERNIQRKIYLADIEREKQKQNWSVAIHLCEGKLHSPHRKYHSYLQKLRAELAIATGDFKFAKSIYEDMLKQRDLNWARYGLGEICFLQGNFEEAVTILEQVIEQSPMMMEAYDCLARVYLAIEKKIEAEEILKTAVNLSPQAILRQQKLAGVADNNGNNEVASKAYQAAVELGKNSIHKSSSDYSGLAKLYHKNNESEQALSIISAMREEFNNDKESELRAALVENSVYQKLEDAELVEQSFQRAKILFKNTHNVPKELQLEMAMTCHQNDDPELADQVIGDLIKNHIDDDVFIDEIKAMQKECGKGDESARLIKETRKELVEINNKGVRLFKQGRLPEAVQLMVQAREKMPGNKTIILNFIKILLQDAKVSGFNKDKLLQIQQILNQAIKLGIEPHKIGRIKMEYSRIIHAQKRAEKNAK
jgi:DNA-binding response OmpR family regulator